MKYYPDWHPFGIFISAGLFIIFIILVIHWFAERTRKNDFKGGNRWH